MVEIFEIKIADLKPYLKNTKKHPKDQIKKICKSIKEFGFNVPIIVDKDFEIIAGHGRLLAAQQLKLETIPAIQKTDLTKEQIKAYRIADNKTAESEWDIDFLVEELKELEIGNYDLTNTGFSADEINSLLGNDEATEDDFDTGADEVETDIVEGDIIQLGNHRLMCGSSTKLEDINKLLDNNKIELCFTDPPYGNGSSGKYGRGQLGIRTIKNDEDFNCMNNFLNFNICDVYVFFLQWRTFKEAIETLDNNNLKLRTIAVWDKKNAGLNGAGGLAEQWEAIIFAGEFKFSRFGGNVFSISREQKNRSESPHPHQKPILLLSQILEYIKDYKIILDPFGGSGSTLIACEQLNRKCYMMELDPKYCEVICQRWEKLTGKERVMINGSKTETR